MLDVRFLADLIVLTLRDAPFPDPDKALPLLLGTAAMESSFIHLRQLGGGPGRGLFQCEPATERDHWVWLHRQPTIRVVFEVRANVLASDVVHLEYNIVYQILLCRLHYYLRDPQPLPVGDDLQSQAALWKKCYNTPAGAGTPAEYVQTYLHLVMPGLSGARAV